MFSNGQSVVFPLRRLADPKFVYVDSTKTDIRVTFRKARLLIAIQKAAK